MFFQNIFSSSFIGSMPLADRQYNLSWTLAGNQNQTDQVITYVYGPWDFSVYNTLIINFSLDGGKNYAPLSVPLPTGTAVTDEELVKYLNNYEPFNVWFKAYSVGNNAPGLNGIGIVTLKNRLQIKIWISNNETSLAMGFNNKAPIGEFPEYYLRHIVQNASNPAFPDSVGQLLWLDPLNPVDAALITAAGFNPLAPQADWQLLRGRVESYTFELHTYDGSGRLEQTIEMHTGAHVGDWARRFQYTYTGVSTDPDAVFITPYVLTPADIAAAVPPP